MMKELKCYHQSVGMATGFVLDGQGSIPSESKIFLFSTASRLALGSNQPPIQRVPGAISPEVKWLGHEADHSPPFSGKVKNGRAIPPLPLSICLFNLLVSQSGLCTKLSVACTTNI
jgi:hypothetical protein